MNDVHKCAIIFIAGIFCASYSVITQPFLDYFIAATGGLMIGMSVTYYVFVLDLQLIFKKEV